MREYGLSDYDARILVDDRALADFFEATVRAAGGEAKMVANWVTGEFLRHLKNDGGSVAGAKITPAQLGALVALVKKGEVSSSAAKDVFAEMWQTGSAPDAIVKAKGLTQVSDESAIAAAVDAVLTENPKAIADYKTGNARALGALVGPVMKRMGRKANPEVVNRLLRERISARD
jgi:aspartyl-tRNA(Asn)/glutamyl-tRNA(Gln) amidotransferase subunit B